MAWLSSHLSTGAAFAANRAGDAYNWLFQFAFNAVGQMAAPWVAGQLDQKAGWACLPPNLLGTLAAIHLPCLLPSGS